MLKTHTCGELRQTHCQQEATLAGWVAVRRDHGGLIFLDLRDRFGITQVTVDSAAAPDAHAAANDVRAEYVVRVRGVVQARPAGFENAALDTGDVELAATEVEILNPSLTPPFYIREEADETEETLRLKYRYLDLRRPNMMRNLMLRHELVRFIRNYLSDRDFIEVETPYLLKSTPEGARDFVVPSRLQPGRFYALLQSPQQLKQLLMVAGLERYFQIARCFRDEDFRADRQPEFSQLDLEMSFVDRRDVQALIEDMLIRMTSLNTPHAHHTHHTHTHAHTHCTLRIYSTYTHTHSTHTPHSTHSTLHTHSTPHTLHTTHSTPHTLPTLYTPHTLVP